MEMETMDVVCPYTTSKHLSILMLRKMYVKRMVTHNIHTYLIPYVENEVKQYIQSVVLLTSPYNNVRCIIKVID